MIGGATIMENSGETALFGNRPARVLGTNQAYDPATNTWATRSPMPTTRNHAFSGVVNGKIYVIGGRLGAAHVTASSNTDVVEEYDPARDLWGAVKSRMPTRGARRRETHDGRIYVEGGEGHRERANTFVRSKPTSLRPIGDHFRRCDLAHAPQGGFIGTGFPLSGKRKGKSACPAGKDCGARRDGDRRASARI